MHWALTRGLVLASTFRAVLGLNQSDGYNIGVVLGSIIGALLAVAIIALIFYMFCIRRWLGLGEPPELGYARQNDYNFKKQPNGHPVNFGNGTRNQGRAPPYGGNPSDGGRRQGTANDYQYNDNAKPQQHYPAGAAPRYEGGGGSEAVVLSGSGDRPRPSPHSSNASYSSESGGVGKAGFEATRTYQARSYTAHAPNNGSGGSPVSAAYLGTGV